MTLAEKTRTLHGVNLAGWLILEPWVTPAVFASTASLDEETLANRLGRDEYARVVREHRDSFITEHDFLRISSRGYDAVRLPVPWHVFGRSGPFPGAHEASIDYVDAAFNWADAAGLKILLDLALVPGATLSNDGLSMSFDLTPARREAILDVAAALAERYAQRSAFLGIEPLDETVSQRRRGLIVTEGIPLSYLRNLYRDAYAAIRRVAGTGPVVVFSDAGQPGAWRRFMAHDRYENVWLDTHPYRHTDKVDAAGPAGARLLATRSADELAKARTSGLPVMVGEWSAALPLADPMMTAEGRIALERIYVSRQLAAYDGCPAWFFQTWKTAARLSAWDARITLSSFERDMLD